MGISEEEARSKFCVLYCSIIIRDMNTEIKLVPELPKKTLLFKLISSHLAFKTSLVLHAVNIVNSIANLLIKLINLTHLIYRLRRLPPTPELGTLYRLPKNRLVGSLGEMLEVK